jgi:hypothetical protein
MFCNGSFSADPLPFANVRCSSLQRTLVLLRLRAKRSLLEAPLGSAYGRCETSFGGSEFSASRCDTQPNVRFVQCNAYLVH